MYRSIRWFDGHLDAPTIDPVYNAVKDNTSQFSGVGWITDKKVMKTMKEFANDCLPDNFIKGMWHTIHRAKTFSCYSTRLGQIIRLAHGRL